MTIEAGLPPQSINPLSYAGPAFNTTPCEWFERDPTIADTNYPGMFIWGNRTNGNLWMRTDSPAVWVAVATGSGGHTVPEGGTGRATLTNHSVLIGAGINPINFSGPAAAGTILQGAGASADPAFSTATYPATTAQGDLLSSTTANAVVTLAKNTSATRYLANTGASNNAAWDLVNLANGVTGILDVSHGGTGSAGISGTVQTTDATPTALLTLDLGAVPGLYTFDIRVAVYASVGAGTPLGAGYTITGSFRTTGAASVFIGENPDVFEEGAPNPTPTGLSNLDIGLGASGNNAVLTVTGVAAYTIRWAAEAIFTFTGA